MNAVIINISNEDYFLNTCIPNGFLGVNIAGSFDTPQGLSNVCKTSYSMYADMKNIRVGDIIFVHSGSKIYGPFKAESEFVEDSSVPALFQSKNIHYYPDPNVAGSGWQSNILGPPAISDYRRISISHFTDNNGANLSFTKGVDANELFNLKYQHKIFSIAEKWKYPDSSRTIRPIFEFEYKEILKLLEIENIENNNRFTISPLNLSSYLPIEFILNNNIIEEEKIVEGWILSQIGRNTNVDNIFGEFTSFGNNVPIGYMKFMDIIGYKEISSNIRKYKVLEIKKNDCIFPDHIKQLIKYTEEVSKVLCNNNDKLVDGYLIAKSFTNETVEFITNFNKTARTIRLVEFNYNLPTYNSLVLNIII